MRILVASEDAGLLRTIVTVLKRPGREIAFTRRPKFACALAKRVRFDLLLVDLLMRPLGGDDVVLRLRAQGVAVPALVMAARSTETWARLLRVPRVMALAKPFTADELELAVEDAIARWCLSAA